MTERTGALAAAAMLLVMAGCTTTHYPTAEIQAADTGCQQVFQTWQRTIDRDGQADAQAWIPPGYPYLRLSRFLASFDPDRLSPEQRREWLSRAHEKARAAWRIEAASLGEAGDALLSQLEICGQQAITRLQRGTDGWPPPQDALAVPDNYRTLARAIGLYPLLSPVVRWRAGVAMGELMDDYRHDYQPEHDWVVYAPPGRVGLADPAAILATASERSTLAIPDVTPAEAEALFARYAPVWVLESNDHNDVPGRPGRLANGRLQFEPQPVTYTHLSYVRFDGQVLLQLNYQVWFAARPPLAAVDIYAGVLDGFQWRVTLGPDGEPLLYDHVHSCGCYHQWLLVESGLVPYQREYAGEEPLWIAGTVPSSRAGMVLYLSSGEHQLVDARTVLDRAPQERYRLRPYRELRGTSPEGGWLFAENGLVTGSERLERFVLWPTGVVSVGAMRQWGHHAVAFAGRRHLDDPYLLQRYFTWPARAGDAR